MADDKNTLSPEDLIDLIRDTVHEAVTESVAEAMTQAQHIIAGIAPADAPTEKRTIRHHLFSYDLPGGGNRIGFRGETVDLLAHDIARGEKFDAFTPKVGDEPDAPTNSTLAALKSDASDEDMDGWVMSGSVSEIMAAVNGDPEKARQVLDAEQRRGDDARKTLLDPLARIVGSA